VGPPIALTIEGEQPRVEIIDETTVRYSWSSPNPTFLQELAKASPLYIYRPAHYLKQFHAKYTDEAELAKKGEESRGGAPTQLGGAAQSSG
jgi:peptide/nickel transport system substrate-binding protein